MIVLPAPVSSASRKRIRRQGQEIAVDRLDLMGKRVDDAGVHSKERIELVGDANALRLCPEQEELCVTVERVLLAAHPAQGQPIPRWTGVASPIVSNPGPLLR